MEPFGTSVEPDLSVAFIAFGPCQRRAQLSDAEKLSALPAGADSLRDVCRGCCGDCGSDWRQYEYGAGGNADAADGDFCVGIHPHLQLLEELGNRRSCQIRDARGVRRMVAVFSGQRHDRDRISVADRQFPGTG